MLSTRSAALRATRRQGQRYFSSPIVSTLQSKIDALAKQKTPQFMALRKEYADVKIGDVTVGACIGGARGIKCILSETSILDPMEGITYRGRTLNECNDQLPKAPGGKVGLPEAAFWLLLTNEIPTEAEVKALNEELHKRSTIPEHVYKLIDGLPKDTHPMTQLSIGLLALQPGSEFGQAYRAGTVNKADYWKPTLEDSLTLLGQIPLLTARIFRNIWFDGKHIPSDPTLDWAGNYAQMMGVDDSEGFKEVTRLYLMLHADHEGGNVSAHTTQLVGSALSDPYYSWAAGLCGLAGPLHGLANQECLAWLKEVMVALNGKEPTKEFIVDYVQKTLKSGKVVPGFGHAVLRQPDPRYMLEREFALKHCKDDPLFKLVDCVFQAVPPTLEKTGKVKNPYPNVDAHSGQLMYFYNLKQENYYTVVFAVSRSMGVMAQYIWSRALGLPIERPKSIGLDVLAKAAGL
mmetsp:Transcript_42769/g.64712  ORF Transcript_42769/g.64712 Transcript_42769/m.64712 type:complete len:461 (-) Transcript_42769:118-1500(-)